MMRHLGLAGLLWWAVTAQASPTWNGLWRTPDQRAQQLLQQGKAAEASRLFQDPRRKAYAELQAGNFSQAAQDFHAFNDTDGQYNRGNALARAGHLQEAIQAYDAALAHDPDNADARHNR
ncbi:MAG: tetratricopeptide repeat protein, partial [Thiobacillus sp.]|nr:tetratricopeptide repeat protein [Thiobacillus sp.]MBN8773422.1 tetratricopeptide repeat protein [Thiobacillus sp.]